MRLYNIKPSPLSMARWDAKFKSGSIYMPSIMLTALPTVRAFVLAYREWQNSYIIRTKQCLSGLGIGRLLYGPYLAFAHEVANVPSNGEGGAVDVDAILAKWVARGLGQATCEAIRDNVFGIAAPTP